ncbi:GNAT superfamily N-acetyltransferase [Desulfobaculum xiamenense]|uniref:GNAT superfamily N-acetyltransferase n=1 Tax=Desulfobaculum xiamenense TaxID=995050 RepID=A0A846QRX6_9BACT|nr:GNAT family N-acetyltransferase [Desulfobaculum xiamenense]NJB69282.1 GNAT superfamily N-acetyltransferase [Desulfobaculum xiamenense]
MSMTCRPLLPDETAQAAALIEESFDHGVAPLYPREGIEEFKSFVTPQSLRERLSGTGFAFAAERDGTLVGVVEVRDGHHIAMLFVAPHCQRQGIGRMLLRHATTACLERDPTLDAITVFSSPNSVGAYKRFGFAADGPEQEKNGIRYTPMTLDLSQTRN